MIRIISPASWLVNFFMVLNLRFTKPQKAHALNFMEGIIMHEANKTLSGISRLHFEDFHPSSMADFFTYSPWDEEEMKRKAQAAIGGWVFGQEQLKLFKGHIIISIDDSLTIKPTESEHFELADWHFDAIGKSVRFLFWLDFICVNCYPLMLNAHWKHSIGVNTIGY